MIAEIGFEGYKINPGLPAGLSFNVNTGVISGTPTAISPATTYTVIATNASGSSNATITITVNLPAKPIISYSTPQTYTATEAITPLSPVSSGGPIAANNHAFSISPQLPSGFSFDVNTGVISGTPATATAAANYVVTATNLGGSGTDTINIQVNPYPKPSVTYTTPQSYVTGLAIPPLSPTASNVGAAGGSVLTTVGTGFANLTGVAVDTAGNVYVTDEGHNTVHEKLANGGAVVTLGSGFSHPTGVAVDVSGNVYVADNGHNAVKEIPAGNGAVVTIATGFNGPFGIAIDAAGNLYVGDTNNNQVKKIPAGSNTPVVIGSGFNHPTGVAVDAAGNVYVADNGNNLVEKILASNGSTVALSNGYGNLYGIAVDPAGNVYFGDTAHGDLTEIPAAGGSNIQIGSGLGNIIAVAAGAADPNVIYFGSAINAQVNKITPAGGYYISPALPDGLTFSQTTGVISGTPALVSAAANYTVRGYNVSGSSSATVNIAVYNTNSGLAGLAVSSGTLAPAFATAVTSYAVNETNATTSITITPTASQSSNTITVNGTTVASGGVSAPISLNVGANAISVLVKSAAGKTVGLCTVTANRAPSANAALASMSISAGTLSPSFFGSVLNYQVAVSDATTQLSVTPVVADPTATITVNNQAVASGSASSPVSLSEGMNTVSVVVTAQDGTTMQTYTIAVDRSANDNLSSLKMSKGIFSPAFDDATTSYTDAVANAVTSVTVTPTASDPGAMIQVNGTTVASGTASGAINLNVGSNTINVVVTASDNVTTKNYVITVARGNNIDNLSSLKTSKGVFSPTFAAGTTSYTDAVGNTITSVTVTPTTSDPAATVTVNGTAVPSGTASGAISLNVGANTVSVVVTAQNGASTQTYTVTVNRAGDNNDNLTSLKMSKGIFSPTFAAGTTSYTDAVGNTITSVTVTPTTSDPDATIQVNGTPVASGTASGAINLAIGANTINVVVTAADNVTTKTYTVTVNRASSISDNLTSLKMSKGIFSPTFASGTTSYTDAVGNTITAVKITPAASDPDATIQVNGTVVPTGAASGLINVGVGANTINVVVTASDNVTTKIYTVTVNRASGALDSYIPIAIGTGISVTKPTETPQLAEDGIQVRQGVSPNGDGINDFLTIDNISQYPDNKLTIMNRDGQLIYEAKGYDNSSKVFDGHSNKNGQMQLPGTYFYQLDYTVNGIAKRKTGFIVLKY